MCVPEPDARRVFLWLFIAVFVDATDGPLARKMGVKTVLPQIDGRTCNTRIPAANTSTARLPKRFAAAISNDSSSKRRKPK
jgi:membrane protein YdbS with pleckstrin-like domain